MGGVRRRAACRAPGMPAAITSACSGGVAGSLGAGDHEGGRRDRGEPHAQVHVADRGAAGRVAARAAGRAASRRSARTVSGSAAGVNQRPSWASATAPVPPASTVAIRSSHISGGPSRADVQQSTSRSTRSGAAAASAIAVMPPSDTPARLARPTPRWSSRPSRSRASPSIVHSPSGTGERAVPARVVADDAEALGERGHLRLPHRHVGAERVAEHHDRRVLGPVAAVGEVGHGSSRSARASARSTNADVAPR